MKPLIIVAAFAAVLTSCSKPAQENTSSDTTATVTTGPKEVQLTGEDLERLKSEVFLRFHELEVYNGQQMVVLENFKYDNGKILYRVVTYNKTHTEYDEVGEVVEGSEGDPMHPVNVYDTVYYKINSIIVTDVSSPEVSTKKFNVVFDGSRIWTNRLEISTSYGRPELSPMQTDIGDFVVDFSGPAFQIEETYLKARIALLDDNDIKRIPEDLLPYFRNEIFARHGHTFKTPKMKKNFENQEWYFEVFEDAGPYLNEFEKKNVEFIKKKEG